MASGDTDVSICSQALLLLGANEITSFSDGTAPSAICNKLYPRVKSQTLGMYPWSFTLKKSQLSQLSSTPTNVYSKEYQLPTDMFLGVPRAVFASTSTTFEHLSLLLCLRPTLRNGVLKYGASIIPEELFPMRNDEFLSKQR